MINASQLKRNEPKKIDVEAVLKQIEADALAFKLAPDGRTYDLPDDAEGIRKIKKTLDEAGFDALSNLTGYRDGARSQTLLVSIKRDFLG